MHLFKKRKLLLPASLLIISGCGNIDTTQEEMIANAIFSVEPRSDNDLLGEDISSIASENISDISNQPIPQLAIEKTSFRLTQDRQGKFEAERDCVVDEENRKTNISISEDKTLENQTKRGQRQLLVQIVKSSEMSRTWSLNGLSVPCNEDSTFIATAPENFQGMEMKATFNRTSEHKMTDTKGKHLKEKIRSVSSQGERLVSWTAVKSDENSIIHKKTVSFVSSKKSNRVGKDGSAKEVTMALKSLEDAPLKVKVVQNIDDAQWQERTIISGSTEATYPSGDRLVLAYDQALWTYEGECEAQSGTISGNFYQANSDSPSKTFTIDLGTSTKTITFTDGSSKDFEISGCAYDRSPNKKVMHIKKDQQKRRFQKKRAIK